MEFGEDLSDEENDLGLAVPAGELTGVLLCASFSFLLFLSAPAASSPRICAHIVARVTHLASAGTGGFDDDIDEDFDEEDEMGIAPLFVRFVTASDQPCACFELTYPSHMALATRASSRPTAMSRRRN